MEELYASGDCTGAVASTNVYEVDVCEVTVDDDDEHDEDDVEYTMRHCSTDILFSDDEESDDEESDDDGASTIGSSSVAAALVTTLGAYALMGRA